jgi:HEAT repeat protein
VKALRAEKYGTVRGQVARTLGNIGPGAKAAVPALTAALREREWDIDEAAASALGQIGPDARSAVPALIEASKQDSRRVSYAALLALGYIGPQAREAVPALIDNLDRGRCLYQTAFALEKLGVEAGASVPALVRALAAIPEPGNYADQQAREMVGKALRTIDPVAARKAGVP